MIKYGLREDGVSFDLDLSKAPKKISRTLHTSITEEVNAIEQFNRGMKRGNIILVTGDRPRFALMRTFPEDKSDPDLIKLGDCRIGVESSGRFEWIDLSDDIRTVFRPSCTEYEIELREFPGLRIELKISQAEDWGAVVKLSLKNVNRDPLSLAIIFLYGGISRHGRTFTASYLDIDNDDISGNKAEAKDGCAILSDSNIPEKIYVTSIPSVDPEITGLRASYHYDVILENDEIRSLYLIVGCKNSQSGSEHLHSSVIPEKLIQEASEYYEAVISNISISTPSKVLDSGFMTAVLNLEYDYGGKLWLEGVHWWSSYWPCNYQISAAISLGQLERAEKALDFLGSLECGPCPVLMASEKPYLNHIGVYNLGIEEGLPYYLYQLIQYYKHTGDKALLHKIWDKLRSSIDHILDVRDGSRSGLLDWHLGCNGFLYQADHLAMPGDAASPSIMMSDLLEQLSVVAFELGMDEDGAIWEQNSKEMKGKLVSRLWNDEEGFFYNHIDYQNIKHKALFYTDLVFPVLYSSFSEDIKFRSLENLHKKLIYETDNGHLLMKAGELKPTIFGNDTVLPAQICESARAFFKTGDAETGFKLLESVSLAGTVYTEAPGNFPERMDNDGKGEANYIFGNPIGSFIYSVISGLFGMEMKESGKTLVCFPAFPSEWEHAELCLPYGNISYMKFKEGEIVRTVYKISSSTARKLEFGVLLDSKEIMISCNMLGMKETLTEFGRTRVNFVSTTMSENFEIEITYAASNKVSRTYKKISKPVSGSASANLLKELDSSSFQPFDLKAYYNSDSITAISGWRHEDLQINLSGYEKINGIIEIEGIPIKVEKSEECDAEYVRLVLLEHSNSHPYTGKTIMSDKSSRISIDLGERAIALAFLYASECQSRQSGIDVGGIKVNYLDGTAETIPLNVGKNIDTLFSHFAEDTLPIEIRSSIQEHPIHPGTDFLNLLVIPCDSDRVMSSVEFIIELPDVQLGLIGMSFIPSF